MVARHQFGLICWSLVALGLLVGILPRARPTPRTRVLFLGLAVLTLVSALSLFWTSSAERTLEEVARVSGYAGLATLLLLGLTRREWGLVATGVFVGGVVVCALAVASRLLPALIEESQSVPGPRLAGSLGYWNALSSWSAATFTMGLAWSVATRRVAHRGLALATTPIAGICLYLTYSRGGAAAAVVGLVAVVVLGGNRSRTIAHAVGAGAVTAMVIAVVRTQPQIAEATGTAGAGWVLLALAVGCGVAWVMPRFTRKLRSAHRQRMSIRTALRFATCVVALAALAPVVYALLGEREPVIESTGIDPAQRLVSVDGNRPGYWATSLAAFGESPLGGLGAGTFEFYWAREGGEEEQVRDAHSLFLEHLAELGLLGLGATLILVTGLLLVSVEPLRSGSRRAASVAMPAVVAVFVVHAGADALWEATAVGALAITAACSAAAAGSARRSRSPESREPRVPDAGRLSRWRVAGVTLVVGLGVGIQIPGLIAGSRLHDAALVGRAGFTERALELSSDAINATPWAASPYAVRALLQEAARRPSAAIKDMLEAVKREPLNFRYWLAIGRYQQDSGNRAAARAAYEQVRSLAPLAGPFPGM